MLIITSLFVKAASISTNHFAQSQMTKKREVRGKREVKKQKQKENSLTHTHARTHIKS